jgi:hypothetical protein
MSARRLIGIATGLVLVAATSISTAPAFAADIPDAIDALSQVPGLAQDATSNTSTDVATHGIGFTAHPEEGGATSLRRAGARTDHVSYAEHGQSVVENTAKDTDTVVQQLEGGGRILEVLGSDRAPHAFTYQLDIPEGQTITKQPDGELLIGTQHKDGDQISVEATGLVGAPWAVDAAGKHIPASYDVGPDGTITMHVQHDKGTQYPVVADPTYTAGGFKATWSVLSPWSVTVYLNEKRSSDAEDLGAAMCVFAALIPVVGAVVAAICALHNAILRIVHRAGYCQKWTVNLISRSFDVGLYSGSFCS